MWQSPRAEANIPRRYRFQDLAALLEPLGRMIEALRDARVADVVDESILQRMAADELVFAVQETFRALLEGAPVPPGGHPGYQEAIIAELLHQTHARIEVELALEPDRGKAPIDSARRSAWRSFTAFCAVVDERGRRLHPLVEHLGLVYDDPLVHRSRRLGPAEWDDILLSASGVSGEFLADDDWRMDWLLDRPTSETGWMLQEAGIDLDTVHRLPHSPTGEEYREARSYLRGLAERHEAGR